MATPQQGLRKLLEPRAAVAAVVRRIVPASPRHGFDWVHQADGSVTFHERGFVQAAGPSALLTRHNYEVQRIRQELASTSVAQGLEVGCGFGRLSPTLAEFSRSHTALDVNESAVAAAKQSYPHLTFQRGSAVDLPMEDRSVNLVCTWTVLQHVRPSLIHAACKEILRVAAPGAVLLLCEETRHPERAVGHTWHRTTRDYEALFAPMTLLRHGLINIPGMLSPGEVMFFQDIAPINPVDSSRTAF